MRYILMNINDKNYKIKLLKIGLINIIKIFYCYYYIKIYYKNIK